MRSILKSNRRTVVAFMYLVLYPLTAIAGQDLFRDTTGVTIHQGLYALFMGFWGALAAFLEQWAVSKESNSWGKLFFKDLSAATLASYITLLVCVWLTVTAALIGAFCAIGGYGGSRTLKWYQNKAQKAGDQALGS